VVVVWLLQRRRDFPAVIDRAGRRAAPLLLAAWLPFLFNWRIWAGHEVTTLVLIALFALSLHALVRTALATPPVLEVILPLWLEPALVRLRALRRGVVGPLSRARWLPWVIVLAGVAGYALHFSYHTINTHYRLGTASMDLGLEHNLVWNAAHLARPLKTSPFGGPDAVLTGWHQPWFAYFIVPFYKLSPRPETLLIFQAIMMGLAAVPLFMMAKRRLGAGIACVVALCYLLYPPVHGSALYDFHYQPLSTVFLFLAFYLLRERRNVLAAITILVAFSVREDISFMVSMLGAFLLLSGERPRAGLLVMILGASCFVVQKFVIMPHFAGGAQAFIGMYKNLTGKDEHGFGGVIKTVVANPVFTLNSLLERDKLIYVLQLFAPVAFLPFRRPIGLLMCVPGFFFTLLATEYPPLVQISFQYTAWWTPLMFIGTVASLERWRQREQAGLIAPASRRAGVVALAGAMLVCTFQFGAILDKHNTKGGFGLYRFGLTAEDHARHANAYALIAQVPPLAKIVAGERIVPQVSARPDAYMLRGAIYDAEYLMFETPLWGEERDHVLPVLRDGSFGIVDERGEFVLARRGAPTTRNAEIRRKLGD
jgi:uncharacterized membrane protein